MADLYYGYAERNASDEINWSAIGKSVTDMLKKETDIREEKKAAIDKASREFGETLSNAPQGEHQGINQWALTYADSAQKARLMQDRLLKSGQLKPKDYFVMRQNINDGTTQAFNLIKEYQAEYKDKMDRYQNGDSQALEQWLMAEAEGFGNFNDSELYINPTNFTVNIAKKKKEIVDGKEVYVMSKDPNDFTTVNAMRNRIKGKFNRLDVDKTLQGGVNVLGKDMNSLVSQIANTGRGGLIKSIKDITQRPDFGAEVNNSISLFERAESTYLDSIMAVPNNTSSILTDYVNVDPKTKQAYTYTWDENKAGGNVILLKNDSSGRPVPQFTKEQNEVAKNALREKFRIMLDREIELKPTPQVQAQYAPEYVYNAGKGAKNEQFGGNMLAKIYSGTPAEQQAGVDYILGLPNIKNVSRTNDALIVTTIDGVQKPISFKAPDGTLKTQDDFIRSATSLILGNKADINQVLKGAVGTGRNQFQEGTVSGASESTNPGELYNKFISSSISAIPTDETEAVDALSPILSKIGFTVEEAVPGKDYIVIKNNNGVKSSQINLSDPKAVESIQGFLLGNVPGKDEKEKYAYLYNLMKNGVFGQQGKPNPNNPTPPSQIKTTVQGGTPR